MGRFFPQPTILTEFRDSIWFIVVMIVVVLSIHAISSRLKNINVSSLVCI